MDDWVVAAVAGAGCIAKYCQNLSRNRNQQRCPLRRLIWREKHGERILDMNLADMSDNFENLESPFSNEDLMSKENADFGNNFSDLVLSKKYVGDSCCSSRKKGSHRYKAWCSQVVKPVSSFECCLMAQLYMEQAHTEEHPLTFLHSLSAPTWRPLIVTNGLKIISRVCGDDFNEHLNTEEKRLHDKPFLKERESVIGLPSLPKLPEKMKNTRGSGQQRKLFHSQEWIDGSFIFCLGIFIGIVSDVVSHKQVNKLTEMLTHTENLVQDLQEELEMKDSLIVKELNDENLEPQNSHDYFFNHKAPIVFTPQENLFKSKKYDDKERYHSKAEEKTESIRNIEAELKAELERLELGMNTSGLKTKHVEVDPEQGKFEGRVGVVPDTTDSTKYAISPKELTLRLHEIIQSRLEERVKELETALDNSQRKVRSMELDRVKSRKYFPNNHSNKPLFSSASVTESEKGLNNEFRNFETRLDHHLTSLNHQEEEKKH